MEVTRHPHLISETFQGHVYIAQGNDVIVVSLDTNDTVYEKVAIGHAPLLVRVFDLAGDLLMVVHYSNNARGYVAVYRHVPGSGWLQYGNPVLVYSPDWYDTTKISNVLVFEAQDYFHFSRTTIYAAVAYQWNVHIMALIDSNFFQLVAPEPCDNIVKLNFNERRQALFIECLEGTMYNVFGEDDYYGSELWGGAHGKTAFSQNGRFGAIVSDENSTLAVVDLHIQDESAQYFTVHTQGVIGQLEFVSVDDSHHYVCYTQSVQGGEVVNWIKVETALAFPNTTESASGQLVSTERGSYRLSVHEYFVAVTEEGVCGSCDPSVGLYDMRTLTNTWNILGIDPLLQAWQPLPEPVAIATTPTPTPEPENETDSLPSTSPIPVPTPENGTGEPTEPTDDTPTQPIPQDHTPSSSCDSDLRVANQAYNQLLWVTVVVCVSFCLAMVVNIILLVTVISVSRRQTPFSSDCRDAAYDETYNKTIPMKIITHSVNP